MNLVFLIATRYLRARKGDGFVSVLVWFSLIGILLGVATLIIVMSVMNGFRHDLQTRILGINGHIIIENNGGIPQNNNLVSELALLETVVQASPMINQQVLVVANNRVSGALARGINAQSLEENTLLAQSLNKDLLRDFDSGNGVIIGERMAWELGISPGDPITLMAPQANQTAFGSSPRRKTFQIIGTFKIGMSEYDRNYLFMPLAQAQKLFKMKNYVSSIEVMIENPNQATEIIDEIHNVTRPYLNNAYVQPWQYRHASFFQALKVERNVMFIILSLVVMIAAFNIIISQVMMVRDKMGSIAILRAVGASRKMIMGVFFCTGAFIGTIGTLLGLGLGVAFALNIETIRRLLEAFLDTNVFSAEVYFLSTLPARLESGDVISIISLAILLSFAASLYAAWQSVRIDPVQVLRHVR